MNTSQSTINRHLEKLGKVSELEVWVPHNLSERNKEDRMSIATSLPSRVKIEPFLNKIIAGDDKWITYENIACKRSGLIRIHHFYQIQKQTYMAKRFYCMYGGIVKVEFFTSC